ncbi:MAG TPA: hypothetical protein PLS95_10220 [Thermoanaerobaculales bacterium]|nr:hypothetical protein [Thermoanaerobaculales bacterium]HQN96675.1 hypothetical protein [Thermoanaerobaculales bacterium]
MTQASGITTEARRLDPVYPLWLGVGAALAAVGVGGAAALAAAQAHGWERLLETYLVSFSLFLALTLGALFFVMLQHITRAGWSVVVRRIAEALACNVWLMAALALPILLGMGHLYHWSHSDAAAGDPILAGKSGFLNPAFFVVRLVVYFAIWGGLAWFFHRTSTRQDGSFDPRLTVRMERAAGPGLVLYALSTNFAAFDLLMSLDPHWFSTIYGVYFFAVSVVCFLAVMPKILVGLQVKGVLARSVTIEHYHDLGKLLFAFVVFWAYIAFSQYMLIWYGNIPEETQWYLKRQTGDWAWVSLALLIGHFVLPFLVLVSRAVKRRPRLLALTGIYMVVMTWLDLYWLVMPEFSPGVARIGLIDGLCFLGVAGLYTLALAVRLKRHSLIAEGDPRLQESLAFHTA